MPGEIDTGGPRVLHRITDYPRSIFFSQDYSLIKINNNASHKDCNLKKLTYRSVWKKRKNQKREWKRRRLLVYLKNLQINNNDCIKISKNFSQQVNELDITKNHLELDTSNNKFSDSYLNLNNINLTFKKFSIPQSNFKYHLNSHIIKISEIENHDIINNIKISNNLKYLVNQSDKSSNINKLNNHKNDFIKRDKINKRSYLNFLLLLFLILFGNTRTIKSNLRIAGIGTIINIVNSAPVDSDAAIRAERSANLSHITGPSRKIQIFIKNKFLQIFPDGTVNGSSDPSNYTIIQRTSVSIGQLKIQGVATCLYLCMDACGMVYGSREYTEECVFNEMLEQNRYNTYSSVRWSTPRKTFYLGLNRKGQPRKVQYRGNNWDKLADYARVLPMPVTSERADAIEKATTCPKHNIRHHHNKPHGHHHNNNNKNNHHSTSSVSPIILPQEKDERDKFKCRKGEKRKKRKRRCKAEDKLKFDCDIYIEQDHEHRAKADESSPESKRSCEDAASDEFCRQQALDAPSKKRKSRKDPPQNDSEKIKKRGKKLSKKLNNDDEEKKILSKNNNKSIVQNFLIDEKKLKINGKNKVELSEKIKETIISRDRNEKSLKLHDIVIEPDNLTIDSITVRTETTEPSVLLTKGLNDSLDISLTIDTSSVEVSDEDINSHEDDTSTTIITNDYGISMTTMDTTPPERTEDYTKATTTQSSISEFLEVSRRLIDDTEILPIQPANYPIGQFAM